MNDQLIKDEFKRGLDLRNEGKLKEAVSVFKDILEIAPNHPKGAGIRTVLAGVYDDLGDHVNATLNFKEATKSSPKSEMASMGLYLSYVKIKEYELAIYELKRYLDSYPANDYKITLKELLGDLENGYTITYKDIILELAEKNGIRLPEG